MERDILVTEGCGPSRNDMYMHVSFARGPQGTYKLIMLHSPVFRVHCAPQFSSGTPGVLSLKDFRV